MILEEDPGHPCDEIADDCTDVSTYSYPDLSKALAADTCLKVYRRARNNLKQMGIRRGGSVYGAFLKFDR